MTTLPWRQAMCEQMVPMLLPQVNRLNVYLEGFDFVPRALWHPKIHVINGNFFATWTALKSNAKMYWVAQGFVDNGHHFTVDDDIGYPPDYVSRSVDAIDRHGRAACVGYHGSIHLPPVGDYYKDRISHHFTKALDMETRVHTIGTGTLAWHTSTLKLTIDDFKEFDDLDLRVAIAAQKQNVRMLCLARDAGYLTQLGDGADPRMCSEHSSYKQRLAAIVNEHTWRLV